MLIVSDKQTVGIGGKSGLSGTRKTEEEGNVPLLDTHVGGRVQGELAELDRLQVVLKLATIRLSNEFLKLKCGYHDREDTLFHFARVFSAKNNHLHAFEVDFHRGGRAHTLCEAVGGELASVVNDKVRLAEICELSFRWSDEHVVLIKRYSEKKQVRSQRDDIP
jgi:hypothetical protein